MTNIPPMTVNKSWKLRQKISQRIRTYEQALDVYKFSKECAANSKEGGYHLGRGDAQTRQYPLVYPTWPRTYVGQLPVRVNASTLDDAMYTSNDQVPRGRIAFYYAPSGGWGRSYCRLENSLELVLWYPDGRCFINPVVAEVFQHGRRERAEQFSDIALWKLGGFSVIRLRRNKDGSQYGRWKKSKTEDKWVKDTSGVFIWGSWGPLIIPKNRRERPYLMQEFRSVETDSNIPRLASWAEMVAEGKARAKVHRKMNGLMRTMQNNPDHLRYFLDRYRHLLGINLAAVLSEAPTGEPAPVQQVPAVEWLNAGERHDRQVFLDDH